MHKTEFSLAIRLNFQGQIIRRKTKKLPILKLVRELDGVF